MDMFTVTTNEDAELRQYRHMLQGLSGFCAAAAGHEEGLRRVSLPETLAAASAGSQILRCFLKPNATGREAVHQFMCGSVPEFGEGSLHASSPRAGGWTLVCNREASPNNVRQ